MKYHMIKFLQDYRDGDLTFKKGEIVNTRVDAAFRDPDGDVLVTDDKTMLEAWYVFEVYP